jgi:hypothetical protein
MTWTRLNRSELQNNGTRSLRLFHAMKETAEGNVLTKVYKICIVPCDRDTDWTVQTFVIVTDIMEGILGLNSRDGNSSYGHISIFN